MIINMKLLAATAAFASTEETRYYLCGVLLEVTPSGVAYVATDGHRMIVSHKTTDDAQSCDWTGPAQIIVPFADCKRLKLSKRAAVEDADLKVNADGSCTFTHRDLTWSFKPIDGTFPDWRQVLPSDSEGKAQSFWNYRYAVSFSEFAEKMEFGQAQIIQRDGSSPMPVIFSQADCNSFGILMPVRRATDATWSRPAWIDGRAPSLMAAE